MAKSRKAALAVIDVQEDFCEPNGSLAVKDGRGLASVWNTILCRPEFQIKLATRDFHPKNHVSFASQHPQATPFTSRHTIANPENACEEPFTTTLWPDHCVQGTTGCDIIPELDQSQLTHRIDKGQDPRLESYSAFGPPFRAPAVGMSGLEATLTAEGITDLFVVGLAFDYCVKYTAVDAASYGFTTYVLEDATKAVDQSAAGLAATRKTLRDAGVRVVSVDDLGSILA